MALHHNPSTILLLCAFACAFLVSVLSELLEDETFGIWWSVVYAIDALLFIGAVGCTTMAFLFLSIGA